jgi:hypothetical protein
MKTGEFPLVERYGNAKMPQGISVWNVFKAGA